jgi:hypothetical protein
VDRDVGSGFDAAMTGVGRFASADRRALEMNLLFYRLGLPKIRHVFEARQKNRRLGQSHEIPGILVHRNPPQSESEDFDRFNI